MPAKSEKQRKAAAVARENPSKLYKRNKGMKGMSRKQLSDYMRKKK